MTAASRELVAALVGEWTGVYRLWLEPGVLRTESASRCTGRAVLGGRFVALDYHWTDLDGPQEGTVLLGGTDAGGWEMVLVDTWHTASAIMTFTGAGPDADVVAQYGPPEEPWGWRTRIELLSPDELVITAWNVTPAGEEHKATEAVYRR